jgi:hypothetical protein
VIWSLDELKLMLTEEFLFPANSILFLRIPQSRSLKVTTAVHNRAFYCIADHDSEVGVGVKGFCFCASQLKYNNQMKS